MKSSPSWHLVGGWRIAPQIKKKVDRFIVRGRPVRIEQWPNCGVRIGHNGFCGRGRRLQNGTVSASVIVINLGFKWKQKPAREWGGERSKGDWPYSSAALCRQHYNKLTAASPLSFSSSLVLLAGVSARALPVCADTRVLIGPYFLNKKWISCNKIHRVYYLF